MNYPFRPYEIIPNSVHPFGIIYRPVIPLKVGVGDGPRRPLFALLDTGADDSIITTLQATQLGVISKESETMVFRSASGYMVGSYGEITLELRQYPRSYVWRSQVAILPVSASSEPEDQTRIILGHTGFFRYFSVAFDFQRRRLRVRPNRLFVGLAR